MSKASIPRVLVPAELADLLALRSEIRILDVRTPGEFETAHISGAYNVPLSNLSEHTAEILAVKEPVVLVCQTGRRASQAESTLKTTGLPNLHLLDGGMNAWLEQGNAVREGRKRMSLERQVRLVAGGLAAVGAILAIAVDPWFAVIPAFIGSGLVFSAITDTCGMALLLAKLPYNRPAGCDIESAAKALRDGLPPPSETASKSTISPAAS